MTVLVVRLIAAAFPAVLAAQTVVSGLVVSRETGQPLAHALVTVAGTDRYIFTTDSGTFSFNTATNGTIALQVRRIGYARKDTTVTGATSIRIALAQVPALLNTVTVQTQSECKTDQADSIRVAALVAALSQLRLNAETYQTLVDRFPFESAMEVTRSEKTIGDTGRTLLYRDTTRIESKSRWHYEPGKVMSARRGRRTFNIPTLADFADDAFLREHCFVFVGVDTDYAVARIDFFASKNLKEADVEGSIFLDKDNYQIRRSILKLTKGPKPLRSYEVLTDYQSVVESLPIVGRIIARQIFDLLPGNDTEAIFEEWRLVDVKFKDRRP